MNDDEKFELARWLIQRYDSSRVSIANRAAFVLSADALILAGMTFLIDKTLSIGSLYFIEKFLLFISIIITFFLVALSMVFATNAIALVWKTSRQVVRTMDIPKILFFHTRDTLSVTSNFEGYKEKFNDSTKQQMLTYALGELLLSTKSHVKLFGFLRKALRLLLIAMIPFFVPLIILLINIF